jgi:hypothetical protein
LKAVPAPNAATVEFIVGSERGLEAWGTDGTMHRTISAGPALHPRRLDPDHVLAVETPESEWSHGARFLQISLRDGRRTAVAALPPFRCESPSHAPRSTDSAEAERALFSDLDLQDESDLYLSKNQKRVCLTLYDRNINMASVALDVQIELGSGTVQRWLSIGEEECPPPRGVQRGNPAHACDRAPDKDLPTVALLKEPSNAARPQAPSRLANLGHELKDGQLQRRGVLQLDLSAHDYSVEAVSPSGRWQVLGGDPEEGDYLYRHLLLLDRVSGQLYPVIHPHSAVYEERPRSLRWPEPLVPPPSAKGFRETKVAAPDAEADEEREPGAPDPKDAWRTRDAALLPREIQPLWLGTSQDNEVLVLDSVFIRPEVGTFEFNGTVAR